MTIRQAPFFWINIFFILGILIAEQCTTNHLNNWSVVSIGLWSLFLLLFYIRKYFSAVLLLSFLFLNVIMIGFISDKHQKVAIESDTFLVKVLKVKLSKNHYIEGEILHSDQFYSPKAYFYLPKDYLIHTDDQLYVKGSLEVISKPKNYHRARGIFYKLKADQYCLHAQKDLNSWVSKYRELVQNTFSSSSQGIAMALFCGDKSFLSTSTKDIFYKSGSMHLLALSGMHIGILVVLLHSLLFWFRWMPKKYHIIRWMLTCIGVFIYCMFVQESASIYRASLMLYLSAISLQVRNKINPINVISFTSFVLLLQSPYLLFSLSFQLSFLAVFSLCLFPYWSMIDKWNWVYKTVFSLFLMGILANLFTFPIVVHHFNYFAVWGMISGILSGILITVMVYVGGLCLLFSQIIDLTLLFDKLFELLLWWLEIFNRLPQISSIQLSSVLAYGLVVCLICFTYGFYQKDRTWNKIGLFFGLCFLSYHFFLFDNS
ncbi:ComEC/Rec2 family competence protein [Flammeovirga sp. MY04]|uniref:ComEC/Rec2 family competence protein n=1 Tax=Flammeovirga sp. MY04 TaxID=1191459 RepID=UPI0008060E96|nr:ComEC/Rec2 family competence protein [Flammeovirga sp. MY04]ANQ50316.1 ComEC/Rec2 family competence protein [Flammeovirga sp. MY04]